MDIKEGVTFGPFNPVYAQIFLALMEVERLIPEWRQLTVTSGSDGIHAPGSAHYRFQAVDIRTHNLPHDYDAGWLAQMLKNRLEEKFLVLLEDEGTPNEHIHIQLRKGLTFSWPEVSFSVSLR